MFLKDRIIQMFTNNLKISLYKTYFEIPDALKHVYFFTGNFLRMDVE